MANLGMDVSSGFGETYPRFFSLITVVGSVFMMLQNEAPEVFVVTFLLGVHGIFTNFQKAGFLRKLLSVLSGATGALLSFNIIMQLFGLPEFIS